jgi:ribose 5-phosphate isomerase B
VIALACDHGGFELMCAVKSYLDGIGLKYKDFGTHSSESCDYPEIATPAARAVANGECDKGIFICGTGIGISIAANKTPGIRAALCTDCFMADKARSHNDANVLALGARVTNAELAIKIIEIFLNTGFSDNDRHLRRVNMLKALDKKL